MNLSSELSHHEPKKRIRPISIYSVFAFGFVSLMANSRVTSTIAFAQRDLQSARSLLS